MGIVRLVLVNVVNLDTPWQSPPNDALGNEAVRVDSAFAVCELESVRRAHRPAFAATALILFQASLSWFAV